MKRFLLLLSFLAAVTVVSAQKFGGRASGEASWRLLWGKKTLLRATQEDETANVVSLRRSEFRKKNSLSLAYFGTEKGWKRSLSIVGANDAELYKKDGSTFLLSSSALARLAKGQTELKIYTIAIPSDPNVAATVRVRRVHLVTIRLM
ncbi:hypothetical protein [Flaviaesturariibacter terrae]